MPGLLLGVQLDQERLLGLSRTSGFRIYRRDYHV